MKLFVCSYNILFGQYDEVFESLAKIVAMAQSYDHYVICLQEVRNTKKFYQNITTKIKTFLPKDCHVVSLINDECSYDKLGLMTITNAEIVKSFKTTLAKRPKSLIPHTVAPLFGAISTTIKVKDKKVNVTNCHLDFYSRDLNITQMEEVFQLHSTNSDSNSSIILGDFNTFSLTSNFTSLFNRVQKVFIDFKLSGELNHFTCSLNDYLNRQFPGRLFFEILNKIGLHFPQKSDWILYKGLKSHQSKVLRDFVGSDHSPIYSVFEIA